MARTQRGNTPWGHPYSEHRRRSGESGRGKAAVSRGVGESDAIRPRAYLTTGTEPSLAETARRTREAKS
jgi:hypothetical protein